MERPNGNHGWANYSMFSIADEDYKYLLNVTGYSGDAGGNCVYSLQIASCQTSLNNYIRYML